MSVKELKEYCEKLRSYKLIVKVRLKNCRDITVGTIAETGYDRFLLQAEEGKPGIPVRYAFVANISHN